ncbi:MULTISPECIES: stealth conserved region 3 domain-containing protein [unclassified Agrobacterium]
MKIIKKAGRAVLRLWPSLFSGNFGYSSQAKQCTSKFRSNGELLGNDDIGISRSIEENSNIVDLQALTFPGTMRALCRLVAASGQEVYIFDSEVGWVNVTNKRFKRNLLRLTASGCVEIAIVGPGKRLLERYSVYIWKVRENFIECTSPHAPIKRVRTQDGITTKRTPLVDQSSGPIDVVYTWVNADDPAWQQMASRYKAVIDRDRFAQSDELRYSIRSVRLFAPWVRTIYIFSNCHPPEWFMESDNVKWVYHNEVIPRDYLPTFNSHSIETFLHQISGLSDQFLYMNDDFFISDFVRQADFFTPYGASVSRLETYGAIPYLEELKNEGEAEEWQSAAVNGSRLITERFGRLPTKLHRHAPYALSKRVYEELCRTYPEELEQTRRAKFRSVEDTSFTSFLYPHFALARRNSVVSDEHAMVVSVSNYKRFQRMKLYLKLRFFCLNDGGGSAVHNGYQKFKSKFLQSFFPFKVDAEITD